MNRKDFLISLIGTTVASRIPLQQEAVFEKFTDGGNVPNSKYPLTIYKNAFKARNDQGAEWLEKHFKKNQWYNSWRNGIFDFQHYHSITHEVLGIYSGEADVLMGGGQGKILRVTAGDIIVIPAGVGHKRIRSSNLGVVGAYPNGMAVDIMRAMPGERPQVDTHIAAVPFPETDPLLGRNDGIVLSWK